MKESEASLEYDDDSRFEEQKQGGGHIQMANLSKTRINDINDPSYLD